MCEPNDSVHVQPNPQNFNSRLRWFVTASLKTFGGEMNDLLSAVYTIENTKVSLAGEVPDGVCYQEFKTYNQKDIHQHVGLYTSH